MSTHELNRERPWLAWLLIALGVWGLLASSGWFSGLGPLPAVLLFAGVGGLLLRRGMHGGGWGWTFAAFPLFGLALASVAPWGLDGFAFLGSIGLGFAYLYRSDRARWWAVIPAGVLWSLALTALLDTRGFAVGSSGAVLMFGLALTFYLLTRLPERAQAWGVYPAAALAVLGVVSLTTAAGWLLPLVLIGVGIGLLWQRQRGFSS
jgi:hypothetical protein